MKIRILAVVAVIMMLLSFQVSAVVYEYEINAGDDFTSARAGDDLTSLSEKLNMQIGELKSFFNSNGILYLAVSDDTKTQIRLSSFTDNFSSSVGDIEYLNDEKLNEFMASVCGEGGGELTTISDRKFIVTKKTLTDSGGVYTVTQYITVCGGNSYYLSCYNSGEEASDTVKEIVSTFKLNEIPSDDGNILTGYNILIISGILLFFVVGCAMIVGIVRATKKKEE